MAVEFDECFWNKEKHFFGLAPANESDVGMLNNWYNLYVTTKKPILIGHIGGDLAIEAENWTEEQVRDKGRKEY